MTETDPGNHYRFCPRCASSGIFEDKTFSFRCPACGFHFFLNSAAAVTALIFNGGDELLMVRRGIEPCRGMLDLPGGFVDPGESVETALLRELREELRLTPDSCKFYGSFPNRYPYSGTIVHTVDCVFQCAVTDFSGLVYGDDIEGIEFMKPEQIDPASIALMSVKKVLKRLIDERKGKKQS